MQTSNALSAKSVEGTVESIKPILEKKPKLREPLTKGIAEVRSFVTEFTTKIDEYKTGLTAVCLIKNEEAMQDSSALAKIVSESNVDSTMYNGEFISRFDDKGGIRISKDKDWTTWYMVKQKKGDELEEYINNTRGQMINIYSETMKACQEEAKLSNEEVAKKIANFEDNITLAIDTTWRDGSDKETWAEANFDHMPYAACMPILEKFKSAGRF
jgi:hypothetical protein